ncbi:hypothetical protein Zmor_016912 [Zophobas morio]|uniref:Uncharacterized protein n=1 Tax=Zophobas morio TaxID=2755281 RepID=A0AA38I4F6_9CUCU|nr:hypothetical protein Zmor_016912 [Zophobas morio]
MEIPEIVKAINFEWVIDVRNKSSHSDSVRRICVWLKLVNHRKKSVKFNWERILRLVRITDPTSPKYAQRCIPDSSFERSGTQKLQRNNGKIKRSTESGEEITCDKNDNLLVSQL